VVGKEIPQRQVGGGGVGELEGEIRGDVGVLPQNPPHILSSVGTLDGDSIPRLVGNRQRCLLGRENRVVGVSHPVGSFGGRGGCERVVRRRGEGELEMDDPFGCIIFLFLPLLFFLDLPCKVASIRQGGG